LLTNSKLTTSTKHFYARHRADCGLFSSGAVLLPSGWPDIHSVVPILDEPESLFHNWHSSISDIQAGFYKNVTEVWNANGRCTWDVLGFINKIYMPPDHSYEPTGYGAGFHTNVVSSNGDFTLRYTISVTPPPAVPVVGNEPDFGFCNNNLPISGVTSSGSQSQALPPSNTIDNKFNTKWVSTFILNPYTTLDLGAQKSVCGIDIAWSDGSSHHYRFNVSVSTDGTHFSNVLSRTSSDFTTSPQKYTFVASQQARYVKITITESAPGSTKSMAQISEINVYS
jgi:F5/8 type C domain